jgi:Ca2+-binding EF-hand superfamily protein
MASMSLNPSNDDSDEQYVAPIITARRASIQASSGGGASRRQSLKAGLNILDVVTRTEEVEPDVIVTSESRERLGSSLNLGPSVKSNIRGSVAALNASLSSSLAVTVEKAFIVEKTRLTGDQREEIKVFIMALIIQEIFEFFKSASSPLIHSDKLRLCMRALGFHYDRSEFDAFLVRVNYRNENSNANTTTIDSFKEEARANSSSTSTSEQPQHPTTEFTLDQVFSIFTLLFRERDSKDEIKAAFYAISSTGKSVTFKDLKKVCKQLELGFVESDFAVWNSRLIYRIGSAFASGRWKACKEEEFEQLGRGYW